MNSRITDLAFFKQNSFGSNELYRELLDIFVKTTPEMVQQLRNAHAEHDLETLKKVAHKLKSNVQSVGLDAVHALLNDIEMNRDGKMNEAQLNDVLEIVYQKCLMAVAEVQEDMKRID